MRSRMAALATVVALFPLLSAAAQSSTVEDTLSVATFDFEDGSGGPDPQGWSSADLTGPELSFFHVDDFAGLASPYVPLEGSKSLWCGARPDPVQLYDYVSLPGYGSGWEERFESITFAVSGDVTVSYEVRYDLEQNWDFAYLEYLSDMATWERLTTYTGIGQISENLVVPASIHGGSLKLRFVVASDGSFDDQDGQYDSNGALVIDSLMISDGSGIVDFQDFEAVPVGAFSTADGDWTAFVRQPFGDYAGLFDGSMLLQEDPVVTNDSHVWGFFQGSTETYACGGHPEQTAVPTARTPGSAYVQDYIQDAILSPLIDFDADPDGYSITSYMDSDSLLVEFDVYRDLPTTNGLYFQWEYRFQRYDSTWTLWTSDNMIHFGDTPVWDRFARKVAIAPAAIRFQLRLSVVDLCYAIGGVNCDCHGHAPLFDNVRISRVGTYRLAVRNTNDAGPESLRQAIIDLNASSFFDNIAFRIPGPGPHVIQPLTPLPALTRIGRIDGFTQSGSSRNTVMGQWPGDEVLKVALDGSLLPPGSNGIQLDASGANVQGLVIGGFPGAGVVINAQTGRVGGNHIGTDATGQVAVPNGLGVLITTQGSDARVGAAQTDNPALRNLISGNLDAGIQADAMAYVHDNLIGLDATGATPLVNQGPAIRITGGIGGQVGAPYMGGDNWIAYGSGGGIVVTGTDTRWLFSENRIWTESSLLPAIDLGGDGITPNDPGDGDTGPNTLLNHPVIQTIHDDGSIGVEGILEGFEPAVREYRIFFYASPTGDPPQAGTFLQSTTVQTDASGYAPFSWWISSPTGGDWITAVVDDGTSTSELSPAVEIGTGSNVQHGMTDPVYGTQAMVVFSSVTEGGTTGLTASTTGPAPPAGFTVEDGALFFDFTTTAVYTGPVTVCLRYDEARVPTPESALQLLHFDTDLDPDDWVPVTNMVDSVENIICGETAHLSVFLAGKATTTATESQHLPRALTLHQNVPNPFNPTTRISFDVPAGSKPVTVAVYDLAGRRVRTLVENEPAAGSWSVSWDGRDDAGATLASGVYICRMEAGAFVQTRKMVLLK